MEVPAIVPTVLDEPMDFTLIATNPEAMQTAQRQLILWAARKMQAIKEEIVETEAELCQAIEKKWNTSGWRRELLKQKNRVEFYRKIKMALEAGYYIVPPFPLDIFAIRTKKTSPKLMDGTSSNNHDQPAQVLPAGAGRYVDPRPFIESYSEDEKQRDGSMKAVKRYYASEFDKVDFPFKLAKAEIRMATDAALKAKIFDRLGVMPAQRAPDPVVCGEILYPHQTMHRWGTPKAVTFFVAWWLDTKTL